MSTKEFSRKLLIAVAGCWVAAGAGLLIPWALNAKSTVINLAGVTMIVVLAALIIRLFAKNLFSKQ